MILLLLVTRLETHNPTQVCNADKLVNRFIYLSYRSIKIINISSTERFAVCQILANPVDPHFWPVSLFLLSICAALSAGYFQLMSLIIYVEAVVLFLLSIRAALSAG